MAFRPFGKPVRLIAPLPVLECKRLVREKLTPMFERADDQRPRGYFIGPVLILWVDAIYDRGPMLVAWFWDDGSSTRISGRVGPDLNYMPFGIVTMIVLLVWGFSWIGGLPDRPLASPITYHIIKALLVLLMVFLCFGVLYVWHAQRDSGRPMVTFLERALRATPLTDER